MPIEIYNDYIHHQLILTYGDVKRTLDFKSSDKQLEDLKNEMISEHRLIQIEKILNNNA